MFIFGKPLREGRLARRIGKARFEIHIQKTRYGFVIGGTVSGRPGRVEILRTQSPGTFLMNNWQSWGPIKKASPSDTFPELETVYSEYSPYVFSPVPEELRRGPVSDYFIAWGNTLLGFLASRIAHPFFTIRGAEAAGFLEYFDAEFEDPVPLEPLAVLSGKPAENLLEEYARLVREENRIRISPWNPVGWCSWYQYFGDLTWRDVLENLAASGRDRTAFPFEVFQVDDGFQADIGDWTRTKSGYPGLSEIAGSIKERGFRAGVWTAPTSAAETSELYARNPSWAVSESGRPQVSYKAWGKNIHALDMTRPEVKEWVFQTFQDLRKAGFDYFKIDFLFSAAMPGSRHKNITPVQAYREGLKAVRKGVGRSFILGCGAPLLPSAGLVDGMRIGEDTAPFWRKTSSGFQGPGAYFAIKNALLRQFMHRRLWINDPDCVLLRDKDTGLAGNERELYALTSGLLDNMIIVSDKLSLVGEKGKRILGKALRLRGGRSRVLGLFEDDGYVIRSAGGPGGDHSLAVNISDEAKDIRGRILAPRTAVSLDSSGRS